jgi:hypothetical protein
LPNRTCCPDFDCLKEFIEEIFVGLQNPIPEKKHEAHMAERLAARPRE